MRYFRTIGLCLVVLALACTKPSQFVANQMEVFDLIPITGSQSRSIKLMNPSDTEVTHIDAVAFGAGANDGGHFKLQEVRVSGRTVGSTDILIPPGGFVEIVVVYAPRTLETTSADYGLWHTGSAPPASSIMGELVSITPDVPESGVATHRSVLMVQYDFPKFGHVLVELVGRAKRGPHGEVVWTGDEASGECHPSEQRICFAGDFSIDLPGLTSSGPLSITMQSPVPFERNGSALTLEMNQFPDVLILLKGNGPGEPLEGKPVSALSIVIDGAPDITATGIFDGSVIHLENVGFRIRVVLGEVRYDDVKPGMNAAVEFNVENLTLDTLSPFDGQKITMGIETTLSENPSGNELFDQFLGGAQVVLQLTGALQL